MVTIQALWLAILLAAIAVFIVSSVIHTLLRYHSSDYGPLPDEDLTLASLRSQKLGAGNYHVPHAPSASAMRDPAFQQKYREGPLLMLYVRPGGSFSMGSTLLKWFIYSLVISLLVAYLCSRTLAMGADYLTVFRVAGFAGFLAYAGSQPTESIWFFRNWSTCIKNIFDGLVYGLMTGGVFGWLWPR